MSNAQSNTEASRAAVKKMYAAVMASDLPAFFDCFDDSIVLEEPSYLPYGGAWVGKEKLRELIGILTGYLNFSTIKLDSLVADGDTCVGFLRCQTAKDPSETQLVERSIVRNGKIVNVRVQYFELGTMLSPGKP